VVVPAHDEEDHIGACLEALAVASSRAGVPVDVAVVLDDCSDATGAICAGYDVTTVAVAVRNVGLARHAGAEVLLRSEPEPSTVWLANTDADTLVPADWLAQQLRLADDGVDVVAGLVALSGAGGHDDLADVFAAEYRRKLRADGGAHDHVHGANLGVRASTYLAAGGFPPLPAHEDRWLLQHLEADARATVVRSTRIVVRTSGRLWGRCRQGFASTLRGMAGRPTLAEG
jgi:glycosyltransferase involved in cell wall biosynthesis